MLKALLLLAFLLIAVNLHAQEISDVKVDSTAYRKTAITLGAAPSYGLSQLKSSILSFVGMGITIGVGESFESRIYISQNIDNYSLELIFPTEHIYGQSSMGLDGSWVFGNNKLAPMAGMAFIYSSVYWKPSQATGEKFNDYVWMVNPFIGAQWRINSRWKLQLRGGYYFSGPVQLIGFDENDFQSFTFETLLIFRIVSF